MSQAPTVFVDPLDPLTPAFLENPYPRLAELRNQNPVVWSPQGKYWMITRYKEADQVLRDLKFGMKISKWKGMSPLLRLTVEYSGLRRMISGRLLNNDPPDHTRMRSLMSKAFTPTMINLLRPRIEAVANEFIDKVESAGQMDVVADYAFPLPVTVIAEMLGVPSQDRHKFKEWSTKMISVARPRFNVFSALTVGSASRDLVNYFRPLVAERRQKPKDDLISVLVQAQEEGKQLSDDELLSNLVLLLIAGHETTVNLIGNSVHLLLRHPEQMALLKERPELISSAVSEFLRYESPVQLVRRVAYADTEILGQKIKSGDLLFIMLGAANRDPAEFENADTLDITRTKNKHLAFGFGVHHCLGAALAETEGQIALTTLLNRMPRLALKKGVLEYRQPFALRGLKSLPVTF